MVEPGRLPGAHPVRHRTENHRRHRLAAHAREAAFNWQLDANRGRGLVIQTGRHEIYLAGSNYRLFLRPKFAKGVKPSLSYNEVHGRLLRVDEGHFDDNVEFVADRRRNGDNVSNGLWVEADIGVLRVITCD